MSASTSALARRLSVLLASTAGAAQVGFQQTGAGAAARTIDSKIKEHVSVSDFIPAGFNTVTGDATTYVQAAINSGAKRVRIVGDYLVSATILLAANQALAFDGGSLTATAGFVGANGVLYGNVKAGVRIRDPIIDATATAGLIGVNLMDCNGARVSDFSLTKCSLAIQSSNTATRRGIKVRAGEVNLAGLLGSAVYISATKGVHLTDVETYGGKEGIGVYNGSSYIKHSGCESYGHTQDGYVIINGSRISYAHCQAHDNAQSGFTTQRTTAGTNVQDVSYSACQAYANTFDGFDLRGKDSGPGWNVDIRITCAGCVSNGNQGTGFYVVLAEGTTLCGCTAAGNNLQGFYIDNSPRVSLSGCQSFSNAAGVATGTGKAGFIIQDSPVCGLSGCNSHNSAGGTQDYGVSFTGASTDCYISGGNFQNQNTFLWSIGASASVAIGGLAANVSSGVFLTDFNSQTRIGSYCGFGAPSFSAAKGSMYRRVDALTGEWYINTTGLAVWQLK